MTGGREQETRGTLSYMHETAHVQRPLSHDLPLTPVLIMMVVANTYGCYCCCLCIRATQIWEPLAQVTTTGWIPLWYHLSQYEFWETVATCSLHDVLLNKQLLFCVGFSFRVISVYGPIFNALQWSEFKLGNRGNTSVYEDSYISYIWTETIVLRAVPIHRKHSPTQQKHREECLCYLGLT